MIITIDGPAASGKGTLTRALSNQYSLPYLDTGLLYRLVGLRAHQAGIDPEDHAEATKLAEELARNLCADHLNDPELRSALASRCASIYGAHIPSVRSALLRFQKDFASLPGGAILDGRDTGTRIAPQAEFKFFVTADVEVRAERRLNDILRRGETAMFDDILKDLRERDARDAPNMIPAPDAHYLDTTHTSPEDVLHQACVIIDGKKN